jgi:predicted O-methyltransferase YrrM
LGEKLWAEVDDYIASSLVGDDETMAAVLAANAKAKLLPIDVSPAQGKFLELLVRITGARRILEIGTLGGYSAIWMARAMPDDGRIVTLEFSKFHAMVARGNFQTAGVADKIDLRVGAALDTLPGVDADGLGPFDLVFIDADKGNNAGYVEWGVKLSRPGTVIVVDNVVRDGRVIDSTATDDSIRGSRAAFELLGRHPRLQSTALQTVGAKGYDGFAIAVVT